MLLVYIGIRQYHRLSFVQEVLHEGYVFPAHLDTPSAVSKVLLQEAGRMKASQVKKGKLRDLHVQLIICSRHEIIEGCVLRIVLGA